MSIWQDAMDAIDAAGTAVDVVGGIGDVVGIDIFGQPDSVTGAPEKAPVAAQSGGTASNPADPAGGGFGGMFDGFPGGDGGGAVGSYPSQGSGSGNVTVLDPSKLDVQDRKFALPVAAGGATIMTILGTLAVEVGAEVLADAVVGFFESTPDNSDALEGALRGDEGRPGHNMGSFTGQYTGANGDLPLVYCNAMLKMLPKDARDALAEWNMGLRRPIGLSSAAENYFLAMLLSHAPRTLTHTPHACTSSCSC